jgi:hypothetical protein
MRKFFTNILIFLILGVVGFFFGWAQLGVPPGSYGVMRSKTHGLDPQLIREGELRWVWYKLLPTNVSIDIYKLDRVERKLTLRGSLPSGDAYTAFALSAKISPDTRPNFSYDLTGAVSFSLKADSLVSLIREKSISGQADLASFEESLAGDIEAYIVRRLNNPDGNQELISAVLTAGSSPLLEEEIARNFPYIESLSCRIGTVRFPDYRLYRQFQELYEEYVAKQREYLNSSFEENSEMNRDSRLRLEELALYGELLTKYPILLEYLKLEQKR